MKVMHKLFLLSVLPFLFIVLSIIFVSKHKSESILRHHITESANLELNLHSERIAAFFLKKVDELKLMGSAPVVQSGSIPEILSYFEREQKRLSRHIEGLYYNDLEGTVYDVAGVTFSVRDRYYFPQIARSEVVITKVIKSRATQKPIVLMLVPIFDVSGNRTGAVGGTILVKDMLQMIMDIKVGHNGFAVMVDEDDRVISSFGKPRSAEQDLLLKPLDTANSTEGLRRLIKTMRGLKHNTTRVVYDKSSYQAFFKPIKTMRWSLVLVYKESEVLAGLKQMNTLYALMCLCGCIAICLSMYGIKRIVLDPIQALVRVQQQFGEGDLSARFKNTSRDEFGVLSLSFNNMADQLSERTTRIEKEVVERKRTEEALRESEVRFKDIASFLPLALFETDDQGNVTFANPFAFESLGYTQEDLDKGLHMLEVIHPEDHAKAIKMSSQVMQGVDTNGSEYLIQRKDSCTFQAFINTSPTIKDGNPQGLKGYIFDLTEQKKAEQALRASEEKLARSKKMESLGLLAGGVAHDLNNVLAGIVSYPDLLLLDLPADSKLRKPIETIQESGHRAAAIVQDLITVARGVAIAKEPLNLNTIVENYLLSPEFKKLEQFHSTVSIRACLDADLLNISGSEAHLRKVVMNLVSNASEAIEGSGNVIIATMNRYVDKPVSGYDDVHVGEYAVLSVSDDGPGISPDDLERIFEPFYTKKVMGRSGTGLGLAVVWNVVQDLKGYLDVISDENGTTFELYFPITRDEVSDKDLSIPIKDYQGNGESVLVVDDVESQREIACKMLNTLGYKATAVSSGEEAVEYLKEHSVDLILLDMIMDPGINGRETYEKIIKIHPNQKVAIASGFAETDEVKEAQKLGAGQYLKKPLTLKKMGTAVRDELKK